MACLVSDPWQAVFASQTGLGQQCAVVLCTSQRNRCVGYFPGGGTEEGAPLSAPAAVPTIFVPPFVLCVEWPDGASCGRRATRQENHNTAVILQLPRRFVQLGSVGGWRGGGGHRGGGGGEGWLFICFAAPYSPRRALPCSSPLGGEIRPLPAAQQQHSVTLNRREEGVCVCLSVRVQAKRSSPLLSSNTAPPWKILGGAGRGGTPSPACLRSPAGRPAIGSGHVSLTLCLFQVFLGGVVRCGALRWGSVRGTVRTVRYGAVRCDAVWCGTVWYGAVRCGTVRYGTV